MSRYAKAIVTIMVALMVGGFYAGKMYLATVHPKPAATHAYSSQPAGGKMTSGPHHPQAAKPAKNKEGGQPPESAGANDTQTVQNTTSLSNTRHGWGIKRNENHQQPEMPREIRELLARYDAYWIGRPGEKVLYLTFDEGYENGYTPKILDILKANNVKAAFFVTGHYVKT
ncbi:MAG: polysaccharide deacetylase family protein, partial [Desulfofundulus sp.]